jgi:hypothetical protein
MYHFMWGGGRDKVKRDITNHPKIDGGLSMVDFNSFIVSLKVKLISKLLDNNFKHAWRSIVTNQLLHPSYPIVSIESGLAKPHRNFTLDLLNCFNEWKESTAKAFVCTFDACVWGNPKITDIGSKMWNEALIQRGIIYLSDFMGSDFEILSYNEFRQKHSIQLSSLTATQYVSIKLAIRRFNNPNCANKCIERVDKTISLDVITNSRRITGITSKILRDKMRPSLDTNNITQLKYWTDLFPQNMQVEVNWYDIFKNLYATTNNFKLIQHQYKVFMRIATCRYTRFKMKLEDSVTCSFCPDTAETLEHIYINCPKSIEFREKVEKHIKDVIPQVYNHRANSVDRFTCYSTSKSVNFIYLVANWYLGRQFQNKKYLYWDAFIKFRNQFLIGEKKEIRDTWDRTGQG